MQFSADEIIAKLNAGTKLTDEEEIFYMVEIIKVADDRRDAIRILTIARNDNPDLIID